MVQADATVGYHEAMGSHAEPPVADAIRAGVKALVDAVNDSSRQLVNASEKFALEAARAVEDARTRSETAAVNSGEMAEQARQAAEEARSAAHSLQSAVQEAREQIRTEALGGAEQISSQTAQVNEIGARLRQELQQHSDEIIARLNESFGRLEGAGESTEASTSERIEASLNAIEASVRAAQQAAEAARSAADRAEQSAGAATVARLPATLPGEQNSLGAEASLLLERLETDYSLLTRLVQDLHVRIVGLSTVSATPPPPYEAESEEPESIDSEPTGNPTGTVEASEVPQPDEGLPEEAGAFRTVLAGRIQLTAFPVPDFDRLLSLDSALARVRGVKTVTLADYANEEVVFRLELEASVLADELASELGRCAGVKADVSLASQDAVRIRVA